MMNFPHNVSDLIVPIELRDNTGNLITGVVFGDVDLTVEYMLPDDTVFTAVTPVTAVAGTYTSSGWVEIASTGLYQLGLPAAALNSNSYTTLRIVYGTNSPVFLNLFFTGALSAATTRAPANVETVNAETIPYTGFTWAQCLRAALGTIAGNLTDNGTKLRDPTNTKNVIESTNANGNRTVTAVDLT